VKPGWNNWDRRLPGAALLGTDPEIARRVTLLQNAMRQAGFRVIKSEWWHFDDMKARGGIRNVTAADLGIRMP
jgi:D-alanyl-D-alanine dipeptidase